MVNNKNGNAYNKNSVYDIFYYLKLKKEITN